MFLKACVSTKCVLHLYVCEQNAKSWLLKHLLYACILLISNEMISRAILEKQHALVSLTLILKAVFQWCVFFAYV